MVGHWLGDGLATARAERWRKHRKILMPAFHTPVIMNFIPVFNEHAILLCQTMSQRRSFQDFHEYIVNVTLDIICGMFVDKHMNECIIIS
jgi:cytochrome P450